MNGIRKIIKSECGLEKYDELKKKTGFFNRFRLFFFFDDWCI